MGKSNKRDIEELVRHAADLEQRARLADDLSERDAYLWLARRHRDKAALLADDDDDDDESWSRPATKELN